MNRLTSEGSVRLTRRECVLLSIVIALSLVVRVPFFDVPMITDEGGYAYWASIWTNDHQVYRDFEFSRPQGILVVYKLAMALFGGSVWSFRLLAAIFNATAVVAVFLVSREIGSSRAAWMSAILYAIFSASPRIEGFTANAEIFSVAPLAFNALLAWKRRWFLAGLMTAVAFQLKPSGVEGCVLIALWILTGRESLFEKTRATAHSLAGFVSGLVPSLVHAVWIGWGAFWHSLVELRSMVYGPDVASLAAQAERILRSADETISSWSLLAVLTLIAVLGMRQNERRFTLCWIAASLVGMQVGLWWDWHFYVQLIPPLSFAAGSGLVALKEIRYRTLWVTAVVVSAALFVVNDGRLWFAGPKDVSWQIYHRQSYLVASDIAEYIKATTPEDEPIYVAFGQAELYYLAGRKPAVPSQMYYAQAKYFDFVWPQIREALVSRAPSVVVWVQAPPSGRVSGQQFLQMVAEGYEPDASFGSVYLFRRRDATRVTS